MGTEIIIGTHVDDLLAIGSSEEALDKVERAIEDHVKLDKKGQPVQMLGMELKWEKESIILTRTRLIETTYNQHLSTRSLQTPSCSSTSKLPATRDARNQRVKR